MSNSRLLGRRASDAVATDARPARVRHDVRHPHGSIQVSAWHTSFPGELPLCSRCLTSGSAA